MIVESVITNMWWIAIIVVYVSWFMGFVQGWVVSKLFNRK